MAELYAASIPLFQRGLNGLRIMLGKAADHESAAGSGTLLDKEIAVRLRPLAGQVVSACNRAGNDTRRVLGREIPKAPKPDQTYAALNARVAETAAFVDSIDTAEMNRAGGGSITLGSAEKGNLRTMGSTDFMLMSSIPQFFFHLTTIYVILRHNGVALRKPDFLGSDAPS